MVKQHEGYATFMTVLITMGAVLLFMGLSALSSISMGKLGLSYRRGMELRTGADSCLEEALLRLRNDWRYTQEAMDVGGIHCQIGITGSGSQKTIDINVSNDEGDAMREQARVRRKGFSVNLVEVDVDE